jgi:hypothetical protein
MAERQAARITQTPKYQPVNATSRALNILKVLAARWSEGGDLMALRGESWKVVFQEHWILLAQDRPAE